jgi:hypothetical protein
VKRVHEESTVCQTLVIMKCWEAGELFEAKSCVQPFVQQVGGMVNEMGLPTRQE